jgi:predicted transcriptional regulator
VYDVSSQTLTVRITPETREALDAIAASLDRDRSFVVKEALSAYVDTHRWQVDHIRQGLREAEAGRFASPAEVKRAISRLRRR